MVSRAIEAYKKSPAEESPCHTIVSLSEHTRYKDSSVNNHIKSAPQTIIDLGQFMQWAPTNK